MIRSICAWCHLELRPGTEPPSHDICPACAVKMAEDHLALKAHIDTMIQSSVSAPQYHGHRLDQITFPLAVIALCVVGSVGGFALGAALATVTSTIGRLF